MTTIGRNDPCHCGSGKKYKKCHMSKDEEAERKRLEKAVFKPLGDAAQPKKGEPPKPGPVPPRKEGWLKNIFSKGGGAHKPPSHMTGGERGGGG